MIEENYSYMATHAEGSRGVRVFTADSVCLCFFPHEISKTDAAGK